MWKSYGARCDEGPFWGFGEPKSNCIDWDSLKGLNKTMGELDLGQNGQIALLAEICSVLPLFEKY